MKLRLLPDIEIANVSPLSYAEKWKRLQRLARNRGGSWSYEPKRRETKNIFKIQPPMGTALGLALPNDSEIILSIKKNCHDPRQLQSCVEAAKLLMDWRDKNVTSSVEHYFAPLTLGAFGTIRYWENIVLRVDGQPLVVALDHRRQNGYSKNGIRFALSVANQQVRVADPDFEDAELGLLQFVQLPRTERTIKTTFASSLNLELFSADQLESMIEETMRLWVLAQEEFASQNQTGQTAPDTDDLFGRTG